MFNFNSSLIILISVLVSVLVNTKVILPRLKYFMLMAITTGLIVALELFNVFEVNVSSALFKVLLCVYLIFTTLYLESDYASKIRENKLRIRIYVYLILSVIFMSAYYVFVNVEVHKGLSYYENIRKIGPYLFYIYQFVWLASEAISSKNKRITIFISLLILIAAIVSYYILNENIISLGTTLSLLFFYNAVEGTTNYFDSNLVNYNKEIYDLAYKNRKISKHKTLLIVNVTSNNVSDDLALDKLFFKSFYKFSKTEFACILSKKEYAKLELENIELKFIEKGNKASLKYQYIIVDSNTLNSKSFNINYLIDYVETKKEFSSKFYEFSSKDLEEIKKNKVLLERIKDATINDGFEIYYQPIYSTIHNTFESAEALIRLKNIDEIGYVSPEIFIPLAEKHGYAETIGNIVFEKVCAFYNKENLASLGVKYIELNVSGFHIVKENIVKDFTKIVEKYNLKPTNLNIEITESAQINDAKTVSKNLEDMRKLGFKFSMDDFGSGYSNMENIIVNNYELIKIDKSIVWGALKKDSLSHDTKTLLNTCISLAHSLNRKIVAEGVEDEKMVSFLKSHKVEYLQGYYFSKPIKESSYIEFLKTHQNTNK